MYYRHFGLDGPPFRFTPSPAVLYLGAAHRECLAALEWALLHDQCGFMVLLGETGTGKTTLLNAVLARRPRNLQLACVPNPKLSFQEIMRVVLPQLGVVTKERGKLELMEEFERVIANRPPGSRTAIIVDEAQNLTDEALEDLRLLTNSNSGQDCGLQIVLMGHPELLEHLSAHHLRQLRERISTKVFLLSLDDGESAAYIDCRLQAQNGSAQIFEANAIKYLIAAAAGIPRRLNVLCHNALLLAYSKNQKTVTLDVAREVVKDYEGIFLPLNNADRPALAAVKPAIPAKTPVSEKTPIVLETPIEDEPPIDVEPLIRPSRRFALVGATCAAFAVIAIGSILIAKTTNLSNEFNRSAQRIATVVPSANAAVSSSSLADDKTLAPTVGYAPSIVNASAAAMPIHSIEAVSAPHDETIQIHSGDTFHDLAAKYLGSKDRTPDLIKANPQIKNPNSLYVGETVHLPSSQPTNLAGVVQ
jgi:type II secretory pathway predicted ATPase ExeA